MDSMAQLPCYTVGHSNHEQQHFIRLLQQHGITAVADVRSSPYSRHNPQFDREAIKKTLHDGRIAYVFLGDLLGARQTAPEFLYQGTTQVEFKKVRVSESFQTGIDRVIQGMQKGYRLSLMCAEKDPFDCHRFVLVSYALAKKGLRLRHILADGSIIEHEDMDKRLLAHYKKNLRQPSLFNWPQTRAEALELCYDLRNRDIGYRLPEAGSRPGSSSIART